MKVFLRKNIKPRVMNGHPWIYDNEIEKTEGINENGSIVEVWNGKSFVGKGYYNENSIIRVRLMTRKDEPVDAMFFKRKIKRAFDIRKEYLPDEDSFRIIFGEADGIPGFIADKFGDYISIQVNTLGIYKFKEEILKILIELFNPKGIIEKDDEKSAAKEGFAPVEGWIYRTGPELIPFQLNGITFFADTLGQKTGFFLDQRINALSTKSYAMGKTVLDAFTYTGNFGVHALAGGAKHVTFMDYSERALTVLQNVLDANNFDKSRYEIINCNSFDMLRKFDDDGKKFDFTIIDPPSMTKSRDTKGSATKGYKELNLRAMKITRSGGLLSTSSCTQLVYDDEFKAIIVSAAEDTKKILTLLYKGGQGPDHPDIINILETDYLKSYLFRVDDLKNF